MKTLLVFPFSRLLKNNLPNPKNYPWLGDVLMLLRPARLRTVQVGENFHPSIGCDERADNLRTEDLLRLGRKADAFLSIESFFPHMAAALLPDIQGVVIWIVTRHEQFGYERFTNVYANVATDIPKEFRTLTMETIAEHNRHLKMPSPRKIAEAVLSLPCLTK